MSSASSFRHRCPFCHEDVAVTGYGELSVALELDAGDRVQRVVSVDGVEAHRCPFVRERYEELARARAAHPSIARYKEVD